MRLFIQTAHVVLLLFVSITSAASSWSFNEATVSIQSKGAGVGSGPKTKLTPERSLSTALSLDSSDTLKILLTTVEGKTATKAHQVFLTLRELSSGLEESFPFSSRETGKSKLELSQKDLPHQFLSSKQPIEASLIIASFGSSKAYKSKAFDLDVKGDTSASASTPSAPVRYGKRDEIHHIFRDDPKSPAIIITLVFTVGVLASTVFVIGAWTQLGANLNHVSNALSDAPVAHALFFGSIIAMEAVFFLYYTNWNLFQTLPVAGIVGAVLYVSGSRALTEVQERRLAGLRGSTKA